MNVIGDTSYCKIYVLKFIISLASLYGTPTTLKHTKLLIKKTYKTTTACNI